MAEYPTTPRPQYPYDLTVNWKTITSAFDSGKEQRRQKQTYAKYDVSLTYNQVSASDFQTLWNFYVARKGSYEAFYFYTLATSDWDGLFIGTGNAATVTFDLPGKSTSAVTIYADGAAMTAADYTLVTGGGTESSDRVTFDTAPALNTILTCDFTGYMRIRCRFEEDKLSQSAFAMAFYKGSIKLKGLAAV